MRIAGILLLLCGLLLISTAALANETGAQKAGGEIESYCGIAVGEEQQAYEAKGTVPWSLKLIFADKITRNYLSDVEVTVENESGEQMLQTLCEGAWIVMALPEGSYKFTVNYQEEIQDRTISVSGEGVKTEYFFW